MSSLEASNELAARGATAPRIDLKDIDDAIAYEAIFSAGEVVKRSAPKPALDALNLMTVCLIVLKNGFTVIGKSAPASAANFDPEKGRIFAREDAIRQIWPLMGFALRHRLYEESQG